MPADGGLSGLGLIMQLGGSLYLGMAVMVFTTLLFLDVDPPGVSMFLLFLAASAGRSWVHRSAGVTLLYGTPAGSLQRPLSGVKTYIWVALAHTSLSAWVFFDLIPDTSTIVGLLLSLCAWPIALAVATRRPGIAAMAEVRPRTGDFGLEGASILMSILGVIGVLFSAVLLYVAIVQNVGDGILMKTSFITIAGLLLVRSVMHVIAGERGVSEGDRKAATDAIASYVSFGKVVSGVAGVLLAFMIFRMGSVFSGVFLVGVTVHLLLVWPLALDSFIDRYHIDVSLSETSVSRAPDSGLTTLGWLLLAFGSLAVVGAGTSVLFDVPSSNNEMLPGLNAWSVAAAKGHSPWFFVPIAGLQLWAGIELLSMTARARLAAMLYGGIATLVTLYLVWPVISDMSSLGGMLRAHGLGDGLIKVAQLGMALALPMATLGLAVRHGSSMRAVARYRGEESE